MQGSFTGPRIYWAASSLRTEASGYGVVRIVFFYIKKYEEHYQHVMTLYELKLICILSGVLCTTYACRYE